jgi:hypothetical protein
MILKWWRLRQKATHSRALGSGLGAHGWISLVNRPSHRDRGPPRALSCGLKGGRVWPGRLHIFALLELAQGHRSHGTNLRELCNVYQCMLDTPTTARCYMQPQCFAGQVPRIEGLSSRRRRQLKSAVTGL